MINFQTTNTRSIKENKYNFTSLIENASSEKESVKRMINQVTGEEKIYANHLCDKWGFMVAQLVESACNAGDPGSIPGLGRFPGEG